MAGSCSYFVQALTLVSYVSCFLTGDPCHFDTTAVGSAFSGHSEVDLTAPPAVCQSGQIEWHYTFPYLLVTFGRSGLPYTACIRPNMARDGYQFNLVKEGQEYPLQTHGAAQNQWWCQKSDTRGSHMTVKVQPKTTYYMELFDFTQM